MRSFFPRTFGPRTNASSSGTMAANADGAPSATACQPPIRDCHAQNNNWMTHETQMVARYLGRFVRIKDRRRRHSQPQSRKEGFAHSLAVGNEKFRPTHLCAGAGGHRADDYSSGPALFCSHNKRSICCDKKLVPYVTGLLGRASCRVAN